MKTAGGVISIIAGLLGILAAVVTLLIGGFGSALEAEGAESIIGLGWGGIFFSLLIIIFGSIVIKAKTRKPAILLIISSIIGTSLGGTFVAICMVLALIGGIFAMIPSPEEDTGASVVSINSPTNSGQKWKNIVRWTSGIGAILLLIITITSNSKTDSQQSDGTGVSTNMLTADIGSPVMTDKFEITVTSVELHNAVGNQFMYSIPSDGGIYIAVQWQYKNVSGKPISSFYNPSLMLIDSNGTEYGSDIGASSSYATEAGINTKILSDLNPGLTSTDADVFEIARESLQNFEWELRIDADQEIVVSLGRLKK